MLCSPSRFRPGLSSSPGPLQLFQWLGSALSSEQPLQWISRAAPERAAGAGLRSGLISEYLAGLRARLPAPGREVTSFRPCCSGGRCWDVHTPDFTFPLALSKPPGLAESARSWGFHPLRNALNRSGQRDMGVSTGEEHGAKCLPQGPAGGQWQRQDLDPALLAPSPVLEEARAALGATFPCGSQLPAPATRQALSAAPGQRE